MEEDKKIGWGERPDFGNPSGSVDDQSVSAKLNLPDDVLRSNKKPRNLITFLIIGLLLLAGIFLVFKYVVNKRPGFYSPVETWNKFENEKYTFSYPKGTKVSQGAVIPGGSTETQIIFRPVGSLAFGISKVDPELYNNVSAKEFLKTYAEGVLAYNEDRPKDAKSKASTEKNKPAEQTDYSCIPDAKRDQSLRSTLVDGNEAYAFELFCAYQGPEGEYKLFDSIAIPDESNKYFHPVNSPEGSHTYYYVEHNGSIYQIHFDYISDDLGDQNPGNVGGKILKTLKFK